MTTETRGAAQGKPEPQEGTLAHHHAHPFAWPGGYPVYALMDDGGVLCQVCAKLPDVHEGGDADGWRFEAAHIHWEGPSEICANCGKECPPAYPDEPATQAEGESR